MTLPLTRAEAEDFLFHEAALLDAWRLNDWLELLTEDARYEVPANDSPESDSADTLFLIADDIRRIRARVTRLNDPAAHAEFPRSRTRRMISNVRIITQAPNDCRIDANFVIYRFRRDARVSEYVGQYRYRLRHTDLGWRIGHRRAVLDSHELGPLGSVSFIL